VLIKLSPTLSRQDGGIDLLFAEAQIGMADVGFRSFPSGSGGANETRSGRA